MARVSFYPLQAIAMVDISTYTMTAHLVITGYLQFTRQYHTRGLASFSIQALTTCTPSIVIADAPCELWHDEN